MKYSWECTKCGIENVPDRKRCKSCMGWRNGFFDSTRTKAKRSRSQDDGDDHVKNASGSSSSTGSTSSSKRVTFRQDSEKRGASGKACRIEEEVDGDLGTDLSTSRTMSRKGSNPGANESSMGGEITHSESNKNNTEKSSVAGLDPSTIITPNSSTSVEPTSSSVSKKSRRNESLQTNSSFNENLKSALSTHSTLALKTSNGLPPPIPPPFLSHQEECTLRTALAFVMIQARSKNRQEGGEDGDGADSSSLLISQSLVAPGRANGWTKARSNNSLASMGRARCTVDALAMNGHRLKCDGTVPSLLGGLLAGPPRPSRPISGLARSQSNAKLMFDRELKHISEILKLALSAALPLYRGALQCNPPGLRGSNTTNGNGPCAVYDYEAAVLSSNELATGRQSSSLPNVKKQHFATLDGLCQHAVVRLSRLINDCKFKRLGAPRANRVSTTKELSTDASETKADGDSDKAFGDASSKNGQSSQVTNKSRESVMTDKENNSSKHIARDAIVKLLHDNLIGGACLHNLHSPNVVISAMGNFDELSDAEWARQCEERKIEKIMAACHILHRFLFLDKSCSIGTAAVIAICSSLTDLYNNHQRGQSTVGGHDGATERRKELISQGGRLSSIHGASIESSSKDDHCNTANTKDPASETKEKIQVVSSRWNRSDATHTFDMNERRRHVAEAMSQRWGSKRKHDVQCSGTKHNGCHNDKSCLEVSNSIQPLPRGTDVMAVNLLRLLEGAAAIRLHHRQQRISLGQEGDRDLIMEKVASMAATEILTEIRSTTDSELIIPLHVDDVAAFYYNETRPRRDLKTHEVLRNRDSELYNLRPGAKIMLRLHMFDLIKKLTLYEQA